MLGLGLVVSILALLLGGTLFGLLSYSASMKSIASKVAEESQAEDLYRSVRELAAVRSEGNQTPDQERIKLREKLKNAEGALAKYEQQLLDTLHRNRDPDM